MRRRDLLTLAAAVPVAARSPGIRREVFLRSPGKGTSVMAAAFYAGTEGLGMVSIEQRWSRSDTIDVVFFRDSRDNGKTWGPAREYATGERRPEGMLRRHVRAGFADPHSGRYFELWNEGTLPTDDPLEGLRQWNIYYRVWPKGRTAGPLPKAQQVIHEGSGFSATHPLPDTYTGRNCVMLGDQTSAPIVTAKGEILLPVQLTRATSDGRLFNPGGGYTWTEAALLHGRWQGNSIVWRMSSRIAGDPARTTRGMVEPTVALLDDGRIVMVLRGSNDRNPELPGRRWVSFSEDGGWKWSAPEPWTYTNGEAFFSPSSCSQLVKHSSGRLFWLGNITPENPRGNRPRYPFVIGEVDRRSGLLRKSSVRIVDDLEPGENEILTLSNFFAREDRQSHEIAIHMTRNFAYPGGWEGDAMLYRVDVINHQ